MLPYWRSVALCRSKAHWKEAQSPPNTQPRTQYRQALTSTVFVALVCSMIANPKRPQLSSASALMSREGRV